LSDHSIVVARLTLPAVVSARTDRVGAVTTPYGRIVWRDGPLTDGTAITLEHDGEAARDLLLGSLIAHTNGAVLRFLPCTLPMLSRCDASRVGGGSRCKRGGCLRASAARCAET